MASEDKIVTYKQFIKDYNEYYQENVRVVRANTHELPEIIFNLYDTDDFEYDDDKEVIELYY